MPDEIEFLDSAPAAGEDEQLPEPPRSGLPGSTRARSVAVLVALVVVVVVGLIVRGVTSGGPDAAPLTPTAHRSPGPRSSAIASAEPDGGRLTSPAAIFCGQPSASQSAPIDPASEAGMITCGSGDPSKCHTADACTRTGEIPLTVVRPVRARFAGARFTVASTDILRQSSTIWYRYVKLLARDGITIQVLIQQPSFQPGDTGNVDDGSHQIARSVHRGKDLTTVVQITRASGASSEDAAAAALARAPGLLAVG